MAISINGSQIISSGNMDMRVSTSNVVERFFSNGVVAGNDFQPAFNYHGTNGWVYYSANTWNEMRDNYWGGLAGYQKGAGSYGMNANWRYYAPRSGYYYFHTDLYTLCDTNNTANYTHLVFGLNGNLGWNNGRVPYTIYGHGNNRAVGASYPAGPNISAIMYLDEGQYCSVYNYKGNSTNTRVYMAHSFFCGHLIS
jgi:hypothetical protein